MTLSRPATEDARLQLERARDRRARRDAVERNAAKGVGRNIEEGVRLVRAADAFRSAFKPTR
ncbi:MAG TPA: hypothetical protein VF520_12375 [Thermoleophilaceae bacterium]|jgi:hypothetical protein